MQQALEKVLSSSGRIRILALLSQVEQLHLTDIARRTSQSYTAAERHLSDLEEASIVQEHDYGRIRIFKLNLENPRARLLRELILHWDDNPNISLLKSAALNT